MPRSPSVTPSPGRAHTARGSLRSSLSGAVGESRVSSLSTVRAAIKGALLAFLVVGSLVAMATADWQYKDHLLNAGIPSSQVAEIRTLDPSEAQARLMEFEAQISNGMGGSGGSLPAPEDGLGEAGHGTEQDLSAMAVQLSGQQNALEAARGHLQMQLVYGSGVAGHALVLKQQVGRMPLPFMILFGSFYYMRLRLVG